jgi:hypothetical protein
MEEGELNLKRLFLMEFRNAEVNPIVYSRYGKPSYNSTDKTSGRGILGSVVTEIKQNTLIVNVKRLIKENEFKASAAEKEIKLTALKASDTKKVPP